jgi:hypothetical protein
MKSTRTTAATLSLCIACSYSAIEERSCEEHPTCREAFGPGFVCRSDGLCEPAKPLPRCDATFPSDLLTRPSLYRGAVVIGHVVDRSIPSRVEMERSSLLAATIINDHGGVSGNPLGIVFCSSEQSSSIDPYTKETAAGLIAEYLAGVLGVPAVIGPEAVSSLLVTTEMLRAWNTLTITAVSDEAVLNAFDRQYGDDELPGLVWTTTPPATFESRVVARDLALRESDEIVVIALSGTGTSRMVETLTAELESNDMQARFVARYDSLADLGNAMDAAAAFAGGEIVFFSPIAEHTADFLTLATEDDRFQETRFFLTSASATPSLLSHAGAALLPRLRGTRLESSASAALEALTDAYDSAFGGPLPNHPFVPGAYDASWLLAVSAANAKGKGRELTGTSLAQGLRRLSSGPEYSFTPSESEDLFGAIVREGQIDVRGASGGLNFDPKTEMPSARVSVWEPRGSSSGIELEVLYTAE